MANSTNSSPSGGIGFAGVLTIVFITLKLCGFIDWSWWWVLAPLWMGVVLAISITGIVFVVLAIKEAADRRHYARRNLKARQARFPTH